MFPLPEEIPFVPRQFPEVYDLCHTFLHVAQVKKTYCHAKIARDFRMAVGLLPRDSHMAVGFLTGARCKNMLQTLTPLATTYKLCHHVGVLSFCKVIEYVLSECVV